MQIAEEFEDLLASLKCQYRHSAFNYLDRSASFRATVSAHSCRYGGAPFYGVYVARRRDTKEQEVLYIGKGGTLNNAGSFRGQDVFKRLVNVKGKNVPAEKFFGDLVREAGPIQITCLELTASFSPAFAESALLQAHLNTLGSLQRRNKEL